MLARVLEPEVMDTAEEARDYDAMDHVAVNVRFVDDLIAEGPLPHTILDVGTGTARIPIEICARVPKVEVVAIDLAHHMLTVAKENLVQAGIAARVRLERVDAKALAYEAGSFGATVSNSIVHHIPEPARVFHEIWRVTQPGGLVFIRDLARPETDAVLDEIVERYGGRMRSDDALVPSFKRQRFLFRASLCASLTVDEVVAIVVPLGLPKSAVSMTSDRHWTLSTRRT